MAVYSDQYLAKKIFDSLTQIQNVLVTATAEGTNQDACLEPSVTLTRKELKRLTGRERAREAFIGQFMDRLTDMELLVDTDEDGSLVVTKPTHTFRDTFDSLSDLTRYLKHVEAAVAM